MASLSLTKNIVDLNNIVFDLCFETYLLAKKVSSVDVHTYTCKGIRVFLCLQCLYKSLPSGLSAKRHPFSIYGTLLVCPVAEFTKPDTLTQAKRKSETSSFT